MVDGQGAYYVAVLEILFQRPAGPQAMSVADFVKEPLNSLSFLNHEIEARETIVVEEDRNKLDLNRLLDTDDDYEEILFLPEREIVLKDGEYVLGIPEPKQTPCTEELI